MHKVVDVAENNRAIRRFAGCLRDVKAAQYVYLFGHRAYGCTYPDAAYELIIVSRHFQGIPNLRRHFGLHDLYYEVGGDAALDLICLTPEEFEQANGRVTLVREVLPEAIDLLAEEPAPA